MAEVVGVSGRCLETCADLRAPVEQLTRLSIWVRGLDFGHSNPYKARVSANQPLMISCAMADLVFLFLSPHLLPLPLPFSAPGLFLVRSLGFCFAGSVHHSPPEP